MANNICATVILYNPDETLFENIASYISEVSKLIVVDNSEVQNSLLVDKLCKQYSNILYINNQENLGIATALNIACNKALELKQDWILTMDQDSKFVDFKSFLSCFETLVQNNDIGIITPNHTGDASADFQKKDCTHIEKEVVITSGNIVNLKHFNEIGRFDDKLFIDMVDYDFSNKIILNNLKIYLLKNHYIVHHIGEVFQRKNLITRKVKAKTEHNPQRVYYMTRNRLYLSAIYSKSFPREYNFLKTFNLLFIHDITKILLYEGDKYKKNKSKIHCSYSFSYKQNGKMHNMKDLVSICIATYNGSKYLHQQLDSLVEQSYSNIEVILQDDYSSDDTIDIANSYKKKLKIHAMLFKKTLLQHIFPFPEHIYFDAWIASTAASLGSITYFDKTLVKYRQHETNTLSKHKRSPQKSTKALKKEQNCKELLLKIDEMLLVSTLKESEKEILRDLKKYYKNFASSYFNGKMFLFIYKNRELFFKITKKYRLLLCIKSAIGKKLYQVAPFL